METLKNGKIEFGSESELKRYCDEQRREQEKYNGWTNYATWRINLEMLDGYEVEETFEDVYELSEYLKDLVNEFVFNNTTEEENGACISYADAFLGEVNWYEIAENMVSDNKNLIKK